MILHSSRSHSVAALPFTLALALFPLGQAVANWTTLPLPPLNVTSRMAHLSDGRLLYGSRNDFDLQTTFGSATLADLPNAGTWDPSGIAVLNDDSAALGVGAFGPSGIHLFDPSDIEGTFSQIPGVQLQNYSLAYRDASYLYVGGLNGSELNGSFVPKHAVALVDTAGGANAVKIIIDNISDWSGEFAVDLAGNLYVSDQDDNRLYKFTATQLGLAAQNGALSVTDGIYLTTLRTTGSLAVDGLGRVWSAGYGTSGLDVWDPATGELRNIVPELNNQIYTVSAFQKNGEAYVGYINATGYSAGSAQVYGYSPAASVPEPGAGLFLSLTGGVVLGLRRRRNLQP